MLFPILSGVGGAILGGFIVWAWQQFNLQNFKEQFKKQTNFLEKVQMDKEQLKKRHRDLQEKVSVLRTREYQLNEEIDGWKEQFINLEDKHKLLADNLSVKEREIEVLKSSISTEVADETEVAIVEEEATEDSHMNLMEVTPVTSRELELEDSELEDLELDEELEAELEDDLDIEATANSDGATSAEEGTTEVMKVAALPLETSVNFEQNKLEQQLLELRNEKEAEVARWINKYQQLQTQTNNLQAQLSAQNDAQHQSTDFENKQQQWLQQLATEQNKYRLLEQEKLQLIQKQEKLTYEWQARNKELEQLYQQSQQEVNAINEQLEAVVSKAKAIELEPGLGADWEERYKSVVTQFINAKERIRGLEQARTDEIQHLEAYQSELDTQKASYSILLSQFKASQTEIDTLNENIDHLSAELANSKETNRLLSQQFKSSHQHIDELQSSQTNVLQEQAQLTESQAGLMAQFKASQRHINELEAELSETKQTYDSLQSAYQTTNQEWTARYNETIKQHNEAVAQIAELSTQKEQLEKDNVTFGVQNNSIIAKLEQVENDWAAEKAQLESSLAALEASESQKEQARLNLSDQLSKRQQDLSIANNSISELEQTIQTLQQQQEDWQQQLDEQLAIANALDAEKQSLLTKYEAAKENQDFKELYETLLLQQNDYQVAIAELEAELDSLQRS